MAVVRIDLADCINCGWCRRACPTETIKYFSTGKRTHVVERGGCIDCGICVDVCPARCIYPDPYVVPEGELEVAKGKARAFAAKKRKQKQDRDVLIARTLEKLAGSASDA